MSTINRRDGPPRSQGYKSSDKRPIGMTQPLHLNEPSTHSQDTTNFELESAVKPSQYIRRRRHRKLSRDEEKGEQELNDDEYLNRLDADREGQSPSHTFLPPQSARIDGQENATVTISDTAAKVNSNETRLGGRWTHIESEGMSFREFKARVAQVFYAPTTIQSNRGLVSTY